MQTVHQHEMQELSQLIDLIYQGAIDHAVWQSVPEKIAQWLQAPTCTLFTPLLTPDNGGFMLAHNLSLQSMALWATKYRTRDIWAHEFLAKGLGYAGNVARDQDLVTEEEFTSSVMYKEFFQPINIGRLLTGVVFDEGSELPVVCSCNRPLDWPFTLDDVRKYRLILPHLSRALGVSIKLRNAEFKVASSLAALDLLPHGVLLMNGHGAVSFANRAAQHMLNCQDGLMLQVRANQDGTRQNFLVSDGGTQTELNAAIRGAVSRDILDTAHFNQALRIQRPSGAAPYAMHFSALPHANELGGAEARAIVFLTDSEAPVFPNEALLRGNYGLSPSEIRVAKLAIDGASVSEMAEQSGVSENTIKTQLKSIYGKTGTGNRAALVKLLFSLSTS